MSECKNRYGNGYYGKGNVVIDVNRVMDSCRDKDCYEDVPLMLCENGREIVEKTSNIRIKHAEVVRSGIVMDPVRFNKGFYTVDVRFYVKVVCEACICIGKSVEFDGLAICDKRVILYGGESNVSLFRSEEDKGFCSIGSPSVSQYGSLPIAVCEVAAPVALDARIGKYCDKCGCSISSEEVPDNVAVCFDNRFVDNIPGNDDSNGRLLLVSLGLFSVIRLERPGQYIVNGTESCVPEKECVCNEADPCSTFKKMDFPINEFCTSSRNCEKK